MNQHGMSLVDKNPYVFEEQVIKATGEMVDESRQSSWHEDGEYEPGCTEEDQQTYREEPGSNVNNVELTTPRKPKLSPQ